jgi:phage protein D
MLFWSPVADKLEEWQPVGGWGAAFSEQDKLQLMNLFFFFKNKKGYKDRKAETLAHMIVSKQKYKGLQYSEDQERHIREALQAVFGS